MCIVVEPLLILLQQTASRLGSDQNYSGIARFSCDSMAFLFV